MASEPQAAAGTHVTITINGRAVSVPKGMLLVEAARLAGVEIPIFCYHPKLKPVGACRMCLVEIEKMPRLQAACTTPVAEGMVVRTDSPSVVAAQNGVIEFLLANHPLDCPICDKGGECPLQDNAFLYGRGTSRFTEDKRHLDKAFPLSERIILDKERCIMCLRCVRFHREIPGDEALALVDRGGLSEVGVLEGETFDSPFSGNTIELCPVGALTSRQYRFKARPWDLKRTASVCVGCAVGCNVEVHSRDGRILRLVSRENPAVDDGWLCDSGRFDTVPVLAEHRAREPLVREAGELRPCGWDEALARARALLTRGQGGLLASPTLSNEAIWLLEHVLLPRLARGSQTMPGAFWPSPLSPWPVSGDIASLAGCRSLLLVGLDPWAELPVLALWLRRAVVNNGARLVVVGPSNGLHRDTAHWLRASAGEEPAVAAALLRCLAGDTAGAEPAVRAAAEALGAAPAAVLASVAVGQSPGALATLQALAERLGADPASGGVRGCPALPANARGAQELAGRMAANRPEAVLEALADGPATLLLVGDEDWPETGRTRLVQMTSGRPLERDEVEVVLPLAHLYEQAGSVTNLAGRVQRLESGVVVPRQVRPDWLAVACLAAVLGAEVPTDLQQLWAALAETHRAYARALSGGLPAGGRLLEPMEVHGA